MTGHGRAGRTLGLLALCVLALGAREVSAQKIQTIVGPGNQDGLLATQATLNGPYAVAADTAGNVYAAELGHILPGGGAFVLTPQIQRIGADGKIVRYAGTGLQGSDGDGASARDAKINLPRQLAVDGKGNLYFADQLANRVRVIDTKGNIATFAGDGTAGFAGDDGKATAAQISAARGIAADADGNVYIADTGNNRVRMVTLDGNIRTVAGTGNVAFDGDGGKATEASLASPRTLAVDRQGNLYIADFNNNRVRRVNKADANINTVAGNGEKGFGGDGGKALAAQLESPIAIAVDSKGVLYVAQLLANRVRRIDPDGNISTVAGTGSPAFSGESGKASEMSLNTITGLAVDANDNLLIAEAPNNRIRMVTVADGMMKTIAGGPGASGIPASQVSVLWPRGGVRDAAGNFYVGDVGHYRIVKIDANGMASTIVGNGALGYLGDGKKATETGLGDAAVRFHVDGMAFDAAGNLYIPDVYAARVLKYDAASGTLATIAGNGTHGSGGDGGKATEAQLSDGFWNVAFDAAGNLYIADGNNHKVRRVNKDGMMSTFAGNGAENFSGDGGPAAEAGIPGPDGVAVGPDGSIYITDTTDFRVRKVTADGSKIETIAGTGEKGYSGDGGKAIEAQISAEIENAAIDKAGNVYLADGTNNVIRVVRPDGIIDTFAGTTNEGFNGDDKPLKETNITEARDIYTDAAGNLIFAEWGTSHRVRIIILAP